MANELKNETEKEYSVIHGGPDVEVSMENIVALSDAYCEKVYSNVLADELEGWKDSHRKHLLKAIEDPNFTLLFDGDLLIGISGFEVKGETREGSAIIELGSVVIHPDYQGQKLAGNLYKDMALNVLREYSNGVVGIVSKNPAIIHTAQKFGFKEVELREYLLLSGTADPRMNDVATPEMEGFKAFVFDTSKVEMAKGAVRAVRYRTKRRVRNAVRGAIDWISAIGESSGGR